MRHHLRPTWAIPLIGCVVSAAQSNVHAGNAALTDEIVRQWVGKSSRISAVKYVIEGTEYFPKDSIDTGFPEESFSAPRRMTIWFDLKANRMRKQVEREEAQLTDRRFQRTYCIKVFDGKTGREAIPTDRNREYFAGRYQWDANLILTSTRDVSYFMEFDDFALLMAEGIVHTRRRGWVATRELAPPHFATAFFFQGRAVRDDSQCVVLRSVDQSASSADFHDLWVDIEKNAAISRYVVYLGGREFRRLEMWYVPQGTEWRLDRYEDQLVDAQGNLTVQLRFKVLERELAEEFPTAYFSLLPQPGDIVRDVASNQTYRLEADGRTKRPVRDIYLEGKRRPWIIILCGVLVVMVAVGLGVHAVRRRISAGGS